VLIDTRDGRTPLLKSLGILEWSRNQARNHVQGTSRHPNASHSTSRTYQLQLNLDKVLSIARYEYCDGQD
jgi:hypothetical protein